MARSKDYLLAFNRGIIDELALVRADVKRVGMSAATQMNFIPRVMGPMSLRPGFEYIGAAYTAAGGVRMIPFVFNNNDKAIIEVTNESVRVWDDDVALITRATVSTILANGTFDADLSSWTDADQGSAVSEWVSDAMGQYMKLTGTGTDGAVRYQALSIAPADINVEHSLSIIVLSGSVGLRIGTTVDDDDLRAETFLKKGVHSIAFTPTTTTTYVKLFNRSKQYAAVDSCVMGDAGVLTLLAESLNDDILDDLRWAQSGDVIFVARGLVEPPAQIERRSNTSWSVVDYVADNGPFLAENTGPVTLTPSAITGAITVTASQNIFKSTNVGSLYRLTSTGQVVSATLGALSDATNSIRVFGIGDNRRFAITLTSMGTATVDLEQSLVEEGNWVTVAQYTADQNITYNDELDNQVAYYRLKVSAYTSGTATGQLSISTGSITGIVRMTAFTNAAAMSAIVLTDLGGTNATDVWSEGAWSPRRGYPSSVAIFQGRLYWAGKDKVWGSVVDDFYNFDPATVGDSGPIDKVIGQGAVDNINWLVPLRYLAMGADGAEYMGRSTNFEEPLTPSNFNLRELGTYGSAKISPVKIDNSVIYVDKTGSHVMEFLGDIEGADLNEQTTLVPDLCRPNVKRVAAQRRPDTRIHFVRCDGTAVVEVYDKVEEVKCFITVETQGLIEDVCILPSEAGEAEDRVYYMVARVVDGAVVRYLERWAMAHESVGGTENKIADSFLEFSAGVATTAVTGLAHLEGKSVVVWGNGKDLGTYTVTSGAITLTEAVTYAVIGLPYHALFISNKLSLLTLGSSSLSERGRIIRAALILKDTHEDGLQYGTDEDYLDDLPPMDDEVAVTANSTWTSYDKDPIAFNGTFSQDTRLVLRSEAPKPCTVLGVVATMEHA